MRISDTEESISLAETLDASHGAKASHLALREAIYPACASGACHRPGTAVLARSTEAKARYPVIAIDACAAAATA